MKYLGIDYGAKRVGLAISDEAADFVYPLVVIQNTPDVVHEISTICKDKNIGSIVVGESKNFAQEENEIMKEITPFIDTIQKSTGLQVSLHPEFLTSMEAERLQGHNEMHDASAAALILKSFLDTKKNK